MKFDPYYREAKIVRVVDGDTIDLEIDLGWEIRFVERVRLLGIDTPEIRGEERPRGLQAKAVVEAWAKANGDRCVVHSAAYRRGKYGRTLAIIHPSPESDETETLNDLLAKQGYTAT